MIASEADEQITVTGSRTARALILLCGIGVLAAGAGAAWAAAMGTGGTALSRNSEALLMGGFSLAMFVAGVYLWAEYQRAVIIYTLHGSQLVISDRAETVEIDLTSVLDFHFRRTYALTLVDKDRSKHYVFHSHIHDPSGNFCRELRCRLRHVRERQLDAMNREPRSFAPASYMSAPLAIGGGACAWIGMVLPFDSSRPDEPQDRIAIFLIFAILAAASLGASMLARRITLVFGTDGVVLRTPFTSRNLAWNVIGSVQNRKITVNHQRIDHTTLVGPNGRISFSEVMEDYDLAREFAEQQVAGFAKEHGADRVAAETLRNRKLAPYAMVLLCVLLLGSVGSVGYIAQVRILEQVQLDRQGVPGVARVDRVERSGNERAPFKVSFSFVDGSTIFRGTSWAGPAVEDHLSAGVRIPIVYLRNDPEVSRYRDGLDWERARVALRASHLMFALNAVGAGLLLWVTVRGRRRAVTAPGAGRIDLDRSQGRTEA